MKTKVKLVISALIVGGLLSGEVLADEVILKNGDRLTGEVVTLEVNKLILKTSYAGEIFIDWSKVEKIEVDNPVEVLLKNDVSLSGFSVCRRIC